MNSTTIYIMSHKKYDYKSFVLDDFYLKLHIGAAGKNILEGHLRDDSFDGNISEKNSTFCELTGLYYIWKQSSSDNVGLVHYRRFFSNKKYSLFSYKPLTIKKCTKLLDKYDLIVPQKITFKTNIKDSYDKFHYLNDLEVVRNIICRKYPDYVPSFESVCNSHSGYFMNMFVGKKDIIDRYCSWLFPILFEAEQIIDISSYDSYQKRIFGFLSERLFNVWLEKNSDIKIVEVPVINIECPPLKSFIKSILFRKMG